MLVKRKNCMADESQQNHPVDHSKRISSETLALLIVDALVDAKIVKKEDLKRAIDIAVEEINVRKACGDY
jgi:hypothetical protein